MPWVWVAVVLVFWSVAAFAVVAMCLFVRQTDARLGRDRNGVRCANRAELRPDTEAKVE